MCPERMFVPVNDSKLTMWSRLFVPVGDNPFNQSIYVVDKKEDGSVEKKKLYGVRYVPLTDAPPD